MILIIDPQCWRRVIDRSIDPLNSRQREPQVGRFGLIVRHHPIGRGGTRTHTGITPQGILSPFAAIPREFGSVRHCGEFGFRPLAMSERVLERPDRWLHSGYNPFGVDLTEYNIGLHSDRVGQIAAEMPANYFF